MEKIKEFLENQIVIAWVSPLIFAVIAEAIHMGFTKIKETKIGMPFKARGKKDILVFSEYCKYNKIQPIISYGDSRALKVSTEYMNGTITVKADMNLKNRPKNNDNRNFVMVLIKYIPKCNMSYFYRKRYFFSFDVKAVKGIVAMQLEIKNTAGAKIVDEFIPVSDQYETKSFEIRNYQQEDAWKEISEICFTVFLEEEYVSKNTGTLEIKNCRLNR